jgi:hypothetical protein
MLGNTGTGEREVKEQKLNIPILDFKSNVFRYFNFSDMMK